MINRAHLAALAARRLVEHRAPVVDGRIAEAGKRCALPSCAATGASFIGNGISSVRYGVAGPRR